MRTRNRMMIGQNGTQRFSSPVSTKAARMVLHGLRRALALFLSLLLSLQPVMLRAQEIVADPAASAAQTPQIGAAANGMPMVNIATPNGAGLSHNKYANFNVGADGLILNNSTQALARSSLGGLVQGNANLASTGAARVILNEVTGTNRSALRGATEVFGTGADVVIANPNGLTCDGCGFINTPRVTLSTGTPELGPDGALSALSVSRGDVTIGANGADLGETDLFEIISRRASIHGPVDTRGALSLVTGHNRYALRDGSVTGLGTDGNEPAIAVDSSLLGGMYAGSIRIVASDRGAGVNMQGDMAANSGDMTLSADGKLSLGKAYAKGTARATSSRDRIEIGNTLFSDSAIVLTGTSGVTLKNNALVASSGNVSLDGAQVTLGTGAAVAAGMAANGTLSTSGTLSVRADTVTAGDGLLTSGGLLSITANLVDLSRATDNGGESLRSLGAIVIEAGRINATNAHVAADHDITLRAASALTITAGDFLAGGTLLASAASLTSSGSLAAVHEARLSASSGDIAQNGSVQGNDRTALSASGAVTNQGRILSPGSIALSAGSGFTNTASGVMAANNGLDLQAGTVSNAGTIAAQGGTLQIASRGTLANRGTLTGLGGASITAVGAASNGGLIEIRDALFLTTLDALTNSGTINAGSATIEAASLDNRSLLTARNGALAAAISGAASNSGELSAKTGLTLAAGGDIALTGKTLSSATLSLTGLNGGRAGAVTSGANAVTNGETGLTIKAASLSNAGKTGSGSGQISVDLSGNLQNSNLIQAAGSAILSLGGAITNATGAEISANNQLTLSAGGAIANSGKLMAANALNVSTQAGLTNNAAALMQGSAVTLSAAGLQNGGTLTAQSGRLAASVSGNVSNSGELSGTSGLTLAASGTLSNSGKLLSLADMTLDGLSGGTLGAMSNSAGALVNGKTGVSLNALSLTNAGGFGSSTGNVTANLTSNLANTGLLYSGASSTYALDGSFANTGADIIAEQNLTIKGLTGARAGDLVNASGRIEAVSGNLSVNAATITNKRTTDPTVTTSAPTSTSVVTYQADTSQSTGGHVEVLTRTETTSTTTQSSSGGSAAAQMLSGSDMVLATNTLTNARSQIASNGNLSISASTAKNEGIDLLLTTTVTTAEELFSSTYHGFFQCSCVRIDWRGPGPVTTVTTTSTMGAVYGTIEAGGALIASITGYLDNNAVRGGAGQIGLSSGQSITAAQVSASATAASLAATTATAQAGPSASVTLDTLGVSISGLTGRQATFQPAASPDMPYVVETRSQFIDPSKFLGSDYFLKQLGGYNPEANLKRLGDAYFEYRLVSEQIFAQTGRNTLSGQADPYRAMQTLYDNALAQQKALSLTAGVSLSQDQVSRLTTDIVWMEKQKVNGADVLVPRLYLASTTLASINVASAELRGGSVGIEAGGLKNSGAIGSASSIQIASAGNLENEGGSLFAKNDILIDAAGAVSNRSGLISGDNVTIRAATIANDTALIRDTVATGFADRMQQQARIAAKGNLLLSAAGSIQSAGGALEAGKDLTLKAGSEITLGALALQSSSESVFAGGYARASTLTNTLASLSAGGNLVLDAGHNLTLAGADAKAGGTASLKAGNDVTLAAVEDRKSQDLKVDIKSSGLFGTSAKVTSSSDASKVQSSTVRAGTGLTLDAGRDATLSASTLDSKGDLAIDAGRNLTIASAVESASSSFSRKEKGFLSGSSDNQAAFNERTVGSAISASGNVDLYADQQASVSGSSVAAGKALSLSGSSVNVIGAEESHSASQSTSKTGLFVGSGDGFFSIYGTKEKSREQSATVNVASTLKAGTDLSIDAMDTDVNVMGSKLDAGRDLSIGAARDVNVTPGAEESAARDATKRSGFGISFSSGNGGFSIGLGYNKTADSQSQSANTNALSSLNAGRDLSISSGRDITLQATEARAERDLSLNAVRDVNLLNALDATNYSSMHEQLFAGISLNVSSGLAGAASGLVDASSGLSGKNGVYSLAPTALAAMKFAKAAQAFDPNALQGLTNPSTFGSAMQKSGLGSASLTLGFTSSNTTQTGTSATPVVTSLSSGGSLGVVAKDGSITGNGVQIAAGLKPDGTPTDPTDPTVGNVLLSAGKDIALTAARGTSSTSVNSTSASAGIGIDLATFTPVANGSYGTMTGDGSTVTQMDSHVVGTGTVGLTSGKDITLKGAVVSGESVLANAGGSLSIESTPDVALYREKSLSLSGGFGPGGITAGANRGRVDGDFTNVSEQSGILAGSGGYHIGVDGGVNLVGGVIASTAPKDKNSLLADHLTYSDIGNSSSSSISNLGFSLGSSLIPVPNVGQPAEDGDEGLARATLSPGSLTLKNQSQDLASLNTDLSKANVQVEGFDIDELKAKQKSAAALSELLNTAVGDLSEKLHFAEGSAEKVALHAAVGALVSKLAGGNALSGAAAGAATELANGVLVEVLKANPNLTADQKSAITQWVAVAIGAAAGGEAGAAAGLDNVKYNFLTHQQKDDGNKKRAALQDKYAVCKANLGNGCTAQELAAIEQELANLPFEAQSQSTQNIVDLVAACTKSMTSAACINGREELQASLDEGAGLQQRLLGGSPINMPDAILASVLAQADQGTVLPADLSSAYRKALAKDQNANVAIALTAIAVAGAYVAPEVYAYCMYSNPNACVAAVEMSGCIVAAGPCDNISGAVAGLTERSAGKAVSLIEQLAGAETRAASSTANLQSQLKELFAVGHPRNGITIGNTTYLHDGSAGGAKVFEGLSEAQIKDYFVELTGQSLSSMKVVQTPKGIIYVAETAAGNFNLRNFNSSDPIFKWTIDVPKAVTATGNRGVDELKFK